MTLFQSKSAPCSSLRRRQCSGRAGSVTVLAMRRSIVHGLGRAAVGSSARGLAFSRLQPNRFAS